MYTNKTAATGKISNEKWSYGINPLTVINIEELERIGE